VRLWFVDVLAIELIGVTTDRHEKDVHGVIYDSSVGSDREFGR
jgi:hypothetical protein